MKESMLINESREFCPLQILATQSVVIVSIAQSSPGSGLRMLSLRPHPGPHSNFDRSLGTCEKQSIGINKHLCVLNLKFSFLCSLSHILPPTLYLNC